MDRYTYDHRGVVSTTEKVEIEGEDQEVYVEIEMCAIVDRKRGHLDEQAVAFCHQADDAQMIVDALNRAVRDDG